MMTTMIALGLAVAGMNSNMQTNLSGPVRVINLSAMNCQTTFSIDPATCFDDPGFSKRLLQSGRLDFVPTSGSSSMVVG